MRLTTLGASWGFREKQIPRFAQNDTKRKAAKSRLVCDLPSPFRRRSDHENGPFQNQIRITMTGMLALALMAATETA